jgi:hypothetical protein
MFSSTSSVGRVLSSSSVSTGALRSLKYCDKTLILQYNTDSYFWIWSFSVQKCDESISHIIWYSHTLLGTCLYVWRMRKAFSVIIHIVRKICHSKYYITGTCTTFSAYYYIQNGPRKSSPPSVLHVSLLL